MTTPPTLLDLPGNVLIRIRDCLFQDMQDTCDFVKFIPFSEACRVTYGLFDEMFWRMVCLQARRGRRLDTWKRSALFIRRWYLHEHAYPFTHPRGTTVTPPPRCSPFVLPKPAGMISSTETQLGLSDVWPKMRLLQGTPRPAFDLFHDLSREDELATVPPVTGLAICFDEYAPPLPDLEHALVVNPDGVMIMDCISAINTWLDQPLTPAQQSALFEFHQSQSSSSSTTTASNPAPNSRTLDLAIKQSFFLAHTTRADLITLPYGGVRVPPWGSVCLRLVWWDHKPGDKWLSKTEAPEASQFNTPARMIIPRIWEAVETGSGAVGGAE